MRSLRGRGQLIWRGDEYGWYGRWWANENGARLRICRALNTHDKFEARKKLDLLIAGDKSALEIELCVNMVLTDQERIFKLEGELLQLQRTVFELQCVIDEFVDGQE